MEEEIQPIIIEKNNHKKLKSIIILSIILAIIIIGLLIYVFVIRKPAQLEEELSPLGINKNKVIENPTEEDIQNLIETLKLNNNFNQD